MKTFKQEYAELVDWMRKKNKEYDEAIDNDTTPGRDGKLVYDRAKVVKEYNRRLLALKKKYSEAAQNTAVRGQNTVSETSRYASGK